MKKIIALFIVLALSLTGLYLTVVKTPKQPRQPKQMNQVLKVDRVLPNGDVTDVELDTDSKNIILFDREGQEVFRMSFDPFSSSDLARFNQIAKENGSATKIRYRSDITSLVLYIP